jgi:hypothetical protein
MDSKLHTHIISKLFLVLLVINFVGCKSVKNVVLNNDINTSLTTKQIIKEHYKKDPQFKTLQSRVKVEFAQGENSQSYSVNLRVEKNKTIWLSATLGIVRVKITPLKVQFYNKLDNTYFDGNFSIINSLFGTELDFKNVQNILLGNAIYGLKDGKYNHAIYEDSFVLSPKRQRALFEIFYLLNPKNFKMNSQQFSQPEARRMLQIDYKKYQEIDSKLIPQFLKIIALERDEETTLKMEFKSVTMNTDLRFPFRIPQGFKEIMIK